MYEDLTNQEAEKILNLVENTSIPIDEVVKKVEAIETKIKFKAFGKTQPSISNTKRGNGSSARAGAGTQPCLVDGGIGVERAVSSARVGDASQPCQVDGRPVEDVGGSSVRAGAATQPYQGDGGTGGGSMVRVGAVPNRCQENEGTEEDVRGSTTRAGAATQPSRGWRDRRRVKGEGWSSSTPLPRTGSDSFRWRCKCQREG